MEQYIQVVEEEFDDAVELPIESDSTLLLTTLSAQFPGATGLKYRNESTGNWRGVRLNEGKLLAPDSLWSDTLVYCVVYPKAVENKRKGEVFESSGTTPKMKRAASESYSSANSGKTSDLVILGLSYSAEESDLKEYFSTFGEVLMTQIKRDHGTQKSKGFGFIRMGDYDAQMKVLSQRHMVCGRWCDTRLPNSNMNRQAADDLLNRKIFVGRCTEDVTQDELRNYFTKFGEVVDVYIPKPFRAFAFVTFNSSQVAASLCGEDHLIGNASVHISSADPKESRNRDYNNDKDRGDSRGGQGPNNGPNNQMMNNGPNSSGAGGGPNHPGGNMGNMGGFNMGNFPMNPAMFAALATQGMFGMPNMMGGGGPMGGGSGFQSNQQGGNNPSYNGSSGGGGSGYNYGSNYNQGYQPPSGGSGGQNNSQASSTYSSGWGSGEGQQKDIKGTSSWGNSQPKNDSMNSWNNL